MDLNIREKPTHDNFTWEQHAYLQDRLLETALHEVVSFVERCLYYGEYTIEAFLKMDLAFKHLSIPSITAAFNYIEVQKSGNNILDEQHAETQSD